MTLKCNLFPFSSGIQSEALILQNPTCQNSSWKLKMFKLTKVVENKFFKQLWMHHVLCRNESIQPRQEIGRTRCKRMSCSKNHSKRDSRNIQGLYRICLCSTMKQCQLPVLYLLHVNEGHCETEKRLFKSISFP